MMNSWNLFQKDFIILAGESLQFYRKHWIGMSVIGALYTLCSIAIYLGWIGELFEGIMTGYESIKTKVVSVFKKGTHEKE